MSNKCSRSGKWKQASEVLFMLRYENETHFQMFDTSKQLGKIDAKLIEIQKNHFKNSNTHTNNPAIIDEFEDLLILSYLWVLGTYEIIRTISERIKKNPHLCSPEIKTKIFDVKCSFEQIRIPLAKFQAPNRNRFKEDYGFAWPGNSDQGVGWSVSEDIFISRIQLSDKLLNLFENMRQALCEENENGK